jgi:uncharacterized protein YbaP (TraB family)
MQRRLDDESEDTDEDAVDSAISASKDVIRVIQQTAANQIKALSTLPLDQRISKLEELLANKFEVAPGMEPAYEAYRGMLQKALDETHPINPRINLHEAIEV